MKQSLVFLSDPEYIKEFLRRAADLEYDRYSMEKLLQKLRNSKQANLSAKEADINCLKNMNMNIHNDRPRGRFSVGGFFSGIFSLILGLITAIIIDAVIMLIIPFIPAFKNSRFLNFLFDFAYTTPTPELTYAVIIPSIFWIILYAVYLIAVFITAGAKKSKELWAIRHQARLQTRTLKERIGRASIIDKSLEKEIGKCTEELSKLNTARNKFYRDGFIPVEYRNAVPMSMMFDYFRKRICTRLEGPDGAFARFETEIRMDRIAATIDQISSKMDTVIQRQGSILSKVTDIDRHINDIVDGIGKIDRRLEDQQSEMKKMNNTMMRIEDNAELTKYYSEVTARCAQHEMWVNGYSDRMEP